MFMSNRVILCADSTCDLNRELIESLGVHLYPFHIVLEENTYQDGIDLTTDDIVRIYQEKKVLPHTAAINVQEYIDFFTPFVEDGCDIVHISLGSGISSSHQNACLAAEEFDGRVQVVNSGNLSTGSGHLVLEAAARIKEGKSAAQTAEEVRALTDKVHASFVLDTLEFLHKGGRCSALAMFGANLLKLKPSIRVNTADATMGVDKKFRGTMDKVLEHYSLYHLPSVLIVLSILLGLLTLYYYHAFQNMTDIWSIIYLLCSSVLSVVIFAIENKEPRRANKISDSDEQ